MSYKMRKEIDAINADGPVWEAILVVSGEMHGHGNDSWMPWLVDDEDKGSEYGGQGGGYITTEEEELVDQWLKEQGAESGEEVLIKVWW